MHSAAFVLCISAMIATVASNTPINYCGARMCENSDRHTFCQFSEGPSTQCVGYISAVMSSDEKSRVVARLNRRRNEAANGVLQGLPTAGNMLKLRWVEELAHEAQLWADQCRSPTTPEEHDDCRDLYSVPVGQCVASVVGEAPGLRVESMVDIWFMQSMLYKGNVTTYIRPSMNGSFYGDFAQIMWAKSYMVGCGRSRFMINSQGRLRTVERLVCNIAPAGPSPGHTLWAPAPPVSLCPSHAKQDETYTSLCEMQKETLSLSIVDPSMTPEEHVLMFTVLDLDPYDTSNIPGNLDQMYLTRLAVVSLGSTAVTGKYFDALPKKDVIEIIELGDKMNTTNKTQEMENTTTPYTTIKACTKLLSFIGRPKPYNLAELSDIESENYTSVAELREDHDLYTEYEFVESAEDNAEAQTFFTNTTKSSNNDTTVKVTAKLSRDDISGLMTKFYRNSSITNENPVKLYGLKDKIGLGYQVDNNTEAQARDGAKETNAPKDDIDEYLQDPETVRELQEALERMEREMSTTERQGKVRRDLRDLPRDMPDVMRHERMAQREEQNFTDNNMPTEDMERNKSPDNNAIYNMVMKYMPSLRQYGQDAMMPKTASDANRVFCSSFVLVLSLCL